MDGITQEELHFGLERDGRRYFSNVPVARLSELAQIIDDAPLPTEQVVVIEMNETYRTFLLQEILSVFPELKQGIYIENPSPRYRHHHSTNSGWGYASLVDSPLIALIGRMKDPGSGLEKLARNYARDKKLESPDLQGHVNCTDNYGFKMIVRDTGTAMRILDQLCTHSGFYLLDNQSHENPKQYNKKNGYCATHAVLLWTKNTIPNMVFEVQIQTAADWFAMEDSDTANHEVYKLKMIQLPHKSDGYSVVIFTPGKEKAPLKPLPNDFVPHAYVVHY